MAYTVDIPVVAHYKYNTPPSDISHLQSKHLLYRLYFAFGYLWDV